MKLTLAILTVCGLLAAQASFAQSPKVAPRPAHDGTSGKTPPELEKCLYGDNYSCVVSLKKDKDRLSPAATQCIQDLALRGTDDSHPIASDECRNLVLPR